MTRATATPVSSFGPELLALLVRGAKDVVTIPCPTYRQGRRLQMRLHMLRKQLQREKHAFWEEAYRVHTSLKYKCIRDDPKRPMKDEPAVLTLRPKDSEFAELLSQAGVQAPRLAHDPLAEFTPESEESLIPPFPTIFEEPE